MHALKTTSKFTTTQERGETQKDYAILLPKCLGVTLDRPLWYGQWTHQKF